MAVYIYGLECPVERVIRYVGKSTNPRQRLKAHISGAKRRAYDHHTARWIRRLLSDGLRPSLVILREVQADERWQDVERETIASAESQGWRLTNSTLGGEGLDYADPEDEARYRANLSRGMAVYSASPEGKARLKKMVEAALRPEALARRNASIRAAAAKPEHRRKMANVNREIGSRPEVKAAKKAATERHWQRAEYREIITAARNDPEFLTAQSNRLKIRWADPQHREKMNSARWTPEKRREQAERIKAYNQGRSTKE